MKYITIQADSYEEAVKKGREQYGSKLRVHSRKDTARTSIFGKKRITSCEITCFLSDDEDDNEIPVEVPSSEEKKPQAKADSQTELEFPVDENTVRELCDYTGKLLYENDFSQTYISSMKSKVSAVISKALPDIPSKNNIRLSLAEMISDSFDIDKRAQNNLPSVMVFLGAPQSGKTTSSAKIASLYPNNEVLFVCSDSQETAKTQAQKLSKALGIDYSDNVDSISDFQDKKLVLVDTPSEVPEKVLNLSKAKFYAVIPATMKNADIDAFFKKNSTVDFKGIIVSKEDETTTIGNIISASAERNLPILFISSGRKIPKDIKKAKTEDFLGKLINFSIDFRASK